MKFISAYNGKLKVFEGNVSQATKFFNLDNTSIYKYIRGKKETELNGYHIKIKERSRFGKVAEEERDPLEVIVEHLRKYGNTNLTKKELMYLPKIEELFKIKVEHYEQSGECNEDWIITIVGG